VLSRLARVAPFFNVRAALQNACTMGIELVVERGDLTERANAVPMAVFNC